MKLTRYGRREWVLGSLILAAGIAASLYESRPRMIWSLITIVPLALVWAWLLWFFRDPQRTAPEGPGLMVSPADGKVTDITPVGEDSPLGQRGVKIGIFMNIFSVHVNRCPVESRVEHVEHSPGVFLDARNPLAAERNESTTIYLTCEQDGRDQRVVLRQVAGLIARRIVTDVQVGQTLQRGQRIGMIKFGSRCELLVPATLAPEVRVVPGQCVKAGLTVLVAAKIGSLK